MTTFVSHTLAVLGLMGVLCTPALAQRQETRTLQHEGKARSVIVQTPDRIAPDARLPLVVVLHGGGGNAKATVGSYGFSPIVRRGEAIVLYPDALQGSWAVGGVPTGNGRLPGPEHDDVGFVDAAIDAALETLPVDPDRLFVTGASRGGHMTQYMVGQSRHRFRAAGVVIATGTRSVVEGFVPDYPIDFGMIIGTEDPFMPYAGTPHPDPRAELMGVDAIMAAYRSGMGMADTPSEETSLGNAAPRDGCTNTLTTWENAATGARLVLLKVIGGGHVVPGGRQYLPVETIGRACRDFRHADVMWQFFKDANPAQ